MSYYDDRADELRQDTKAFLKSEFGKYVMEILDAKEQGLLSSIMNIKNPYIDRSASELRAIKEVKELFTPLDDNIPLHG